MSNPGSVFLSHSSGDPDFKIASSIASHLRKAGMSVWWDADQLEGGHQFSAEIVEAIIRQYYFLFLVSPRSLKSQWCLRELARSVELGKAIIPLVLEQIAPDEIPLELAGLQHVDLWRGLDEAFPILDRSLGLGLASTYEPSDDPFARDGRLIHVIAEQLHYAKTFTDTLNLILLLSNVGVRCSATERARQLFARMTDRSNFRGSLIDYDRVSQFLLRGWESQTPPAERVA